MALLILSLIDSQHQNFDIAFILGHIRKVSMSQNFLEKFEFNEEKVNLGIDQAILREKNSAPRYNPYYLLNATPDLDSAIERDLSNQSMRQTLRSVK